MGLHALTNRLATLAARLTCAFVHEEFLSEVSGAAVCSDIISQGRATDFDGLCEHRLDGLDDLDDLLAQTGGLTASAGPIFMPSDVLFGYDESFLRPEAITSLEKLGELIRRNPEARFRIEGHTDSFGGADYNAQLSLARADSVKRWLAETMSIDPTRIDTRGLGSTRPLAAVTGTVEEQQLNRRVEIVILRADGGR